MNKTVKTAAIVGLAAFVAACRGVRQQDLDAWAGVPVEALDTHSFFLTLPMYRTITPSGIEIRNYVNSVDGGASCLSNVGANVSGGFVTAPSFTTCSSGRVTCNNIFYIRDGKVLELVPVGRCYSDSSVQPQPRYLKRLLGK